MNGSIWIVQSDGGIFVRHPVMFNSRVADGYGIYLLDHDQNGNSTLNAIWSMTPPQVTCKPTLLECDVNVQIKEEGYPNGTIRATLSSAVLSSGFNLINNQGFASSDNYRPELSDNF